MSHRPSHELFDLSGQTAVVTGGAGVLCSTICRGLAEEGVKVAILDINQGSATQLANEINQNGGEALALACDVCDIVSINSAAGQIISRLGAVDILVNGAGGNSPKATTNAELKFFDMPEEAIKWVLDLNLSGTIFASQVFGRLMADRKKGSILNITSMNALRPLTKIPIYSAAKAAVSNLTQWLAVHMAVEYSPAIRVNALAPGFFLTEQNRYLLMDKVSGEFTERGQTIIDHTPMKRFGVPEDLIGALIWLLSPAASFVTGIVVPIDGGFSAYGGV
jgi:NAD(P)-dependent dehydrogenase (short-subunit alcohol dehydrogenase family)